MAGFALVNNGDVQIGTDFAYLLCQSTQTGFNPASYTRALNFNPWVWPDLLTDDTPLWHRTGLRPGADVPTGRRLQFTIEINRPTSGQLGIAMQKLSVACRPTSIPGAEQELSFMYGGLKYVLYGRYREVDVESTERAGKHVLRVKLSFLATDPIFYECDGYSASIPTYIISQSNYEAPGFASPNIAAVNAAISPPDIGVGGDAPPRYKVIITGAARNPVLMNCFDGQWMWLAQVGGFALANGAQLEIDSAARTIINSSFLNMGYLHAFPSHWLDLDPLGVATLAVAANVNFAGSAAMPSGSSTAASILWQRGWWGLPA